MRFKILGLLPLVACFTACGPTSSAVLSVNKSSIQIKMTGTGDYCFTGSVDNEGTKDAYGAMVTIVYKTLNGFQEEASAATYDIKAGSSQTFVVTTYGEIPVSWVRASCIEMYA